MATGTRIGPDGRPIDEGFFGLGNALASLPGTPVLPGATTPPPATGGYEQPGAQGPLAGGTPLTPGIGFPRGSQSGQSGAPGVFGPDGQYPGGYTGSGENPPEGAYGPWTGNRPTAGSGGTNVSNTGGGTPVANPGLPPPASTAGTGGFFGDTSPWAQNVGASINDQPVSFASPGNPNTNYLTPEAAGKVGQTFGANVVSQNLNNMASPGSSAPSAPIYGLDFGKGDIQDAGMGAFQLARGDRPEDIAARYAAGINNTGWGGPAPATARSDADGMWNYSTPVSTYDPSQSNAQQAQLIQWLRGQLGQG